MIREITAVIVSWKDEKDVQECVRSLAAAQSRLPEGGVRASLVVVDNGGSLSASAIQTLWPGARILVNASTRGFAPAANQGAAAAEGDAVLFLNPDTRADGEPFSPIVRAFDADPRVVAVAPRLTEMDGAAARPGPLALSPPGSEDQATFQLRRLPTLASDARELLLLDHAAPNNRGRRRARYAGEDRNRPFAVEQAAAAALAVRKTALDRVGGFDERFVPAWYEDVDLCDRLAREGVLVYTPEARFRHRGGESAGRLGYDRFLPILNRNALLYRRFRYGALARLAYRGLLATGMALRLALLPLRRSVPRPRAEAARAYGRVFRLALGLESDARLTADHS